MMGIERALLTVKLLAVNDQIKSICLIGPAGSGKSTILALYDQLSGRTRVVVPSHVTTDRLYGSVSLDESIRRQKLVYEDGLLQSKDHSYFLVEQLQQFDEQIAREIVRAVDQKFVQLGREEVVELPMPNTALFTLTEPIETLSETLRDCIGLSVTFTAPSFEQRLAVLRNDTPQLEQLVIEVQEARKRLPYVTIDEALLQKVACMSLQANSFSMRTDLYVVEAAKAHAALEGRLVVTAADVEQVAPLVFNHRVEELQMATSPSEMPQHNPPPIESESERQQQNTEALEAVEIAEHGALSVVVDELSKDKKANSGKAASQLNLKKRGRQIGTVAYKKHAPDLDFLATMKKAIPEQIFYEQEQMAMTVKPHHFVNKRREHKQAQHFIFIVDASQSMHQNEQMTAVKGVVLSLLKDAYQKRNMISFISMYQEQAEVLLMMTKNISLARQTLKDLKVGGKTPLASGLSLSQQVMKSSSIPFTQTKLIVLTDGRANITLSGEQHVKQALQDSLAQAEQIHQTGVQSLVVDTEQGKVKLQKAQQLAKAMQADYISFSQFSERKTYQFIRNGG